MIELKLSQGAKPGKGGILPGKKVTPEIAAIRLVTPYETVYSPPNHSSFSTPVGLLEFIQKLRELSGGKPVGFKLCLGKKREFFAICKAMVETGITPDFITVDGGEGGTGSAPLEFSNSVGTPLLEALIIVENALKGFGLRNHIKIIASAKLLTAFHMVKALALGADLCNAARPFMMALGCIQALECHTDNCPTGVATQKKGMMKGLHIPTKAERVYRLHKETVHALCEILKATGLEKTADLQRWHVLKRVQINLIQNFEELFPAVKTGVFLRPTPPEKYRRVLASSEANSFSSVKAP